VFVLWVCVWVEIQSVGLHQLSFDAFVKTAHNRLYGVDTTRKFLAAEKQAPSVLGNQPVVAVSSKGQVTFGDVVKVDERPASELTNQHVLIHCNVPLRFQMVSSMSAWACSHFCTSLLLSAASCRKCRVCAAAGGRA
jgi:hypothetical protein